MSECLISNAEGVKKEVLECERQSEVGHVGGGGGVGGRWCSLYQTNKLDAEAVEAWLLGDFRLEYVYEIEYEEKVSYYCAFQ